MANNALAISDLPACTTPVITDKLVLSGNSDANGFYLTLEKMFSNTANLNITSNVHSVAILNVSGNSTPANNTDIPTGTTNGGIWADGTYLYYYNGTEIKRLTLSTF